MLFALLCSMNLLPIAILFGAGYFFLNRKVSAAQNLRVELNDIAIDLEATKRSLFTQIYYKVRLNLVNTESASIVVQNIQLQAFSGSTRLGNLSSQQKITVDARSNKVVQLTAVVSSFGLVTELVSILREQTPIEISVNGVVDTDLGRIPVEFKKLVQIPKL